MTKRLSTRVSLRWPPEPAFENTDTLVLSVGNWYVDLRVDRDTGKLDWAIAGERLQDPNSNEVLFTHELDSRNAFGVADCGTFSTLPNGDDLEVGVMPRPDLPGAPVSEYEEVWRELPFPRMEGRENVSFVMESATGGTLGEGEEKEVTRTFIGGIWGTYIALRQRQVLVRPVGETKIVVRSGGEVSARREDFVHGGFEVKYSLGSEADKLPTREDIRSPSSDGAPEKLVVCGQEYIVRSWELSDAE
ncbi:uncharacterized protein DSM5745_09730 [Aspergillus mulundensis]|uniref:Protein HRI1 n=1 Tax=Aspergillus mulundensis TaxID=1810919 RepID=A0A3D8QR83_9EURO|nr:Uncharacterized protein DSM5745_09730 [Aspergillus mulundensis]RDW64319.1 Uncharacterized protein DSM5745_09730 [Aspergillus mulundensis]